MAGGARLKVSLNRDGVPQQACQLPERAVFGKA